MFRHTLLKLAAASALCALVALPLEAQTTVGFSAGLSRTSLGGSDVEDSESALGVSGGAFASFGLSDLVSIRPGAYFTQKGVDGSEGAFSAAFDLSYVDFPVLFRFALPSSGPLGLHFYAGPTVSFRTSCSVSVSGGGRSVEVDCDDPAFEGNLDVETVDFAATGGGGLSFAVGESATILLDAVYSFGLTSIDGSSAGEDVKNRTFQVLGGLEFPIG